jgi:hypothetical protein
VTLLETLQRIDVHGCVAHIDQADVFALKQVGVVSALSSGMSGMGHLRVELAGRPWPSETLFDEPLRSLEIEAALGVLP